MELKNKTAVFLGDSITAGALASCPEKRYYNVLKEKYGLKEVIGYGISGTRIAKQKIPSSYSKFDEYFSLRVETMISDADIVVVFGGTNDFGHGDALLGNKLDRTSDTFYGACHELFEKLINKYPESVIVVMTPLHRLGETNLKGDGSKKEDIAPLSKYVEIIKETAQNYSLPVCDLYANSGLQPNIPLIKEYYLPDGLHPNDKGHERIADRLGEFLKSL